jgi:hypothetical protein
LYESSSAQGNDAYYEYYVHDGYNIHITTYYKRV